MARCQLAAARRWAATRQSLATAQCPLPCPQLICGAFDLMPADCPKTYPNLGRAAAGRAGLRSVLLFSFLELFGGSVVLLMVCWQMLGLLLPAEGE
jgi:hypothetical protein